MNASKELNPSFQESRVSNVWDGALDEITPGYKERISEELRHILFGACRAATMDGFLLVASVIPAQPAGEKYAFIDRTRKGSLFTNLADGFDPISLLAYTIERLQQGGDDHV